MWGIWRNPYDIVASIIRNDFYRRWYVGGLEEISNTIINHQHLKALFSDFIDQANSEATILGLLVAARNYHFFYHLQPFKCIDFEKFIINPNLAFRGLCEHFDLRNFDFTSQMPGSFNIIGKAFERNKDHKSELSKPDLKMLDKIFQPLIELRESKFKF